MPRGIAWDELPNRYVKEAPKDQSNPIVAEETVTKELNIEKDFPEIGKRFAFGAITGGFTGACFGFVEVLRNTKLMTGRKQEATKKILGFTYRFAGFFGLYHGMRKTLKFYAPLSPEMNVTAAAVSCVVPMTIVPTFRPMIPYAVVMILMDVVNGINDV